MTGFDIFVRHPGERTIKITTYGRRTGRPHTVTVWFGVSPEGRVFVSSLRTRDWDKNLLANPRAEVEIESMKIRVRARRVAGRPPARQRFMEKEVRAVVEDYEAAA